MIRSRRYLVLLVLAAVLGVPISALAYGFLQLVHSVQTWLYTDLPGGLGFHGMPTWWPVVPLAIAGPLVAATIRWLPGTGGEVPLEGFRPGTPEVAYLPGIAIAAIISIALGPVVGPEAPLIALGGGVGALVARLLRRVPEQAYPLIAATGSFAAVSTLLGSPIVGAFLLIEVTGLTGAAATLALVPGLLGAGIGTLIFTGLGRWTGHGLFSLALPDLPAISRPTAAELGWAVVIGVLAVPLAFGIRRLAGLVAPFVETRRMLVTTAAGLAVAGLAIGYAYATGHPVAEVLFSGQDQLPGFVQQRAAYSVGALLLLIVCKGLAYSLCLVCFRGGPTFPAMFLGTVGGLALSHLPGLAPIPAMAMGVGAMSVAILRLPFTCTLLATVFFGHDGLTLAPVIIIAVVVAHVGMLRFTPPPPEPPPDGSADDR